MFRNNNSKSPYNMPNPYNEQMHIQKVLYELEEINRKLRNLNNRLRRVENFLGLRNDDKYEQENYSQD